MNKIKLIIVFFIFFIILLLTYTKIRDYTLKKQLNYEYEIQINNEQDLIKYKNILK